MVTDSLLGNQCFCRNKFFWERFSWIHDIHRLLHAPKVTKKYKQFTWFRSCWGAEEIIWSMKATLYSFDVYDALFVSYVSLYFIIVKDTYWINQFSGYYSLYINGNDFPKQLALNKLWLNVTTRVMAQVRAVI